MRRKRMYTIVIVLLLLLVVLLRIYIDNEIPKVSNVEIKSPKLPEVFDGYKIVQLSDLHSKSFGNNNEMLIDMIDKESPNIIVMTGDMVTANEKDFTVFYSLVKELTKKYRVYYVYGNHEGELSLKLKSEITAFLKENEVIVLDNDYISIEKNNEKINLYGLCYTQKYYSYKGGKKHIITENYIKNKLGTIDKNKYNILLTHNPLFFDAYSGYGFDLTLSGHVHGGLIRLPFIGGILSPERKFFPQYSAGVYEKGNSKLVVSRGLSRGTKGFRFFNRPDVVSITLKK